MKFLSTALLGLSAMVDAKKYLTNEMIQTQLRHGHYDKKALMAKAIPYGDTTPRQLEQNNNNNYMANYSIKFNTCVDLKVKDQELLREEGEGENNNNNGNYNRNSVVNMLQSGSVVSQQSYVIFNVCQSSNCYYSEDNASNTYIVDIGTFVNAMSSYVPNNEEQFCKKCEKSQDYCEQQVYGVNGNYAYNEGNVNCSDCYDKGCIEQPNYGQNNNNNNNNNAGNYNYNAGYGNNNGYAYGEYYPYQNYNNNGNGQQNQKNNQNDNDRRMI